MSGLRTFLKWLAFVVAGVVGLLALAVVGLHFWLANSPDLGPRLVARVEQLSGLSIRYAKLDTRLGAYGPELVFREAALSMPGQQSPVVSARAGRVGLDLFHIVRTGRLASVRVVLDGAQVFAFLTEAGVELRGQGVMNQGSHISLADLPVGHVRIEDANITVQDLRTGERPWHLAGVELDLERDPRALAMQARVKLPDALGARLELDVHLKGDLAATDELAWSTELVLHRAALGGWTALVPRLSWLPVAGHGDLRAQIRGHGAELDHAEALVDLVDVVTRAPPGGVPGRLRLLSGVLNFTRHADSWVAAGHNLAIDPGHDAWTHGEFEAHFEPRGTIGGIYTLRSPELHLDGIAALATLLPDGSLREAGLALAPRGTLHGVDVRAGRGALPGEWRLDGGFRFAGLSIGAWRAVPGIGPLNGEWTGQGDHGRVRIAATALTLDLARALREPVHADRLGLELDYWWRPDGWRLSSDDVSVASPDGVAKGLVRLWLPSDPETSPRMVLDFHATGIQATSATRYLPGRILPATTMKWLEHAFLAGRVPDAHIEFAGELRRYPFRDGGGLFRIRFPFQGLRIHFHDEFADIEDASGEAEFKNEGFTGHASTATINGLHVTEATAGMVDFREADLKVRAAVAGDVQDALGFLQASLIGPKLGEFFMGITGKGPFTARVDLDFPLRHFADRSIGVEGAIRHASGHIPGLDDTIRDVNGSFTLLNKELTVPAVSAIVLGGPARLKARTIAGPSGRPGDRVLVVEGQGQALGERVQAAIGITRGEWLVGGTDWKLAAQVPRLEWRPPADPVPSDAPLDAVPLVHEVETRYLPAAVHLEAPLAGLALSFPAPLAKPADETRALRIDLAIDPGVGPDAPRPPWIAKRRDPPRSPALGARLQLGRDAGALEWHRAEAWHLARGTLQFGGGQAQLHDAPGVWVDGRIPDYDLSAWLRVRLTSGPSHGLGEVLRGGSVQIDRFGIFGFHFADVKLGLEARDEAWVADIDAPGARGRIVVPWAMPGPRPLTLDLERLVVGQYGGVTGGGVGEEPTDPSQLPPLAIRVKSLEIQKRKFGSLEADLSRTPAGLKLDRAQIHGASFQASAHGSWVVADGAQASVLSVSLESTDVQDTLNAWGFQQTLIAKAGHASAELRWPGSIDADLFARVTGTVKLALEQGQVVSVDPGAGRVLGLMSVTALPRRLTLDFSDVTEKGFAFDHISGDFEFRDGNAYTTNLVLKGPAAEIGIVGRTGITARDYDQTAKVTGHLGGTLAAAGVLAGGPAVGAALLLFSSVFKEPLGGIARGYYRITGGWDKPVVERIGAAEAREADKANAVDVPH
jgi:uncharacterized protein YhdP